MIAASRRTSCAALNDTLEQRVSAEIQERMQGEDAFRQAQKMEIIGQLTGGVAHDFNNLLQVTMGNLDALRRRIAPSDFPVDEELLQLADAAARGGQRAALLTQRLLAFARKQLLKPDRRETLRAARRSAAWAVCEDRGTDIGIGIKKEVIERAFDSFFTTKEIGRAPVWDSPKCTGLSSNPVGT
jgi:signal transduction histidine kinase